MQIHSVGVDLGKTTFHLVALGAAGKVLVRKKFSQQQLLAYSANMPTSLIGLEACSGAHFLGRALRKQGHDVRLIVAQFVKPFVKSNKNDYADAEAISEAVEHKNMRFVPLKTDDQLYLQAIHLVRDRLISRRTAVINQLPAFLLERGIIFAITLRSTSLWPRWQRHASLRYGGTGSFARKHVSESSVIESSLKCILVSASRTVRLSRRSRTNTGWVSRIEESWPRSVAVLMVGGEHSTENDSMRFRSSSGLYTPGYPWLGALLQGAIGIFLPLTNTFALIEEYICAG